MTKDLSLYQSLTGIKIDDCDTLDVSNLLKYNKNLKKIEVEKIKKAVDAHLYDMAAEYVWSRTINELKNNILLLGNDFVCEMLDRQGNDINSISEYEVISLSADLGLINKTAKLEFLQFSETLQHFMSNNTQEDEEEYNQLKFLELLRSCIKHVLGFEKDFYDIPFITFREQLKTTKLKENSEIMSMISNTPYFYKKTITKTLINLSHSLKDGAERENVFGNTIILVSKLWNDLSADDKWNIGRTYAQANNEGDLLLSKVLKVLLLKVKGFDYVPENLRSNAYIKVAQDLITAHFNINNFYNEVAHAKILASMGTSIPLPALGKCITAVLICKLGNNWGISREAQPYLDEVLGNIIDQRWEYYFNELFSCDEIILHALKNQKLLERFNDEILHKYHIQSIQFSDMNVKNFISSVYENKSVSRTYLDNLINQH